MPAIANPTKFRSTFSSRFQTGPDRCSSEAASPPSSIVPITSATATDNPVIVRL